MMGPRRVGRRHAGLVSTWLLESAAAYGGVSFSAAVQLLWVDYGQALQRRAPSHSCSAYPGAKHSSKERQHES